MSVAKPRKVVVKPRFIRPGTCGTDFLPSQQALEHARSAQRRSRAVLLGEAQATIDVASEAVRRMSGSRREREARPSSETVHHIVKAEVSALDTKVDALQADLSQLKDEVNDKVDTLKAEIGALSGKLDTLISMMERPLF